MSTPTIDLDRPVLLVAAAADRTRQVVAEELEKRYGVDYEVITCNEPARARDDLQDLAARHRDVAIVLAAYAEADPDGLDVIANVRNLHPAARRGVIVNWGEFDRAQAMFDAL